MNDTTVSLKFTTERTKPRVPPGALLSPGAGVLLAREKHSRKDQGLQYKPSSLASANPSRIGPEFLTRPDQLGQGNNFTSNKHLLIANMN